MEDADLQRVMILLAIATPVVAASGAIVSRIAANAIGEAVTRRRRRNLWLVGLAGPVACLLWFILNVWLEWSGPGSIMGYGLAALVFVAAGFATGFFSRMGLRRSGRQGSDSPEAEDRDEASRQDR